MIVCRLMDIIAVMMLGAIWSGREELIVLVRSETPRDCSKLGSKLS